MGDSKHTLKFSSTAFESKVRSMEKRGEEVSSVAKEHYRATKQIPRTVDVLNGRKRVSRNAMERIAEGFLLKNGVSMPIFSALDGTGSFRSFFEETFRQIGLLHGMLGFLKTDYFPQVATGVIQDVVDPYPVLQVGEFEADNRIADQMQMLLPAYGGGDAPEDYDLVLLFLRDQVETDLYDMYGLKPYGFMSLDEVGRGRITPSTAKKHLGITLQSTVNTEELGQQILERWHFFILLLHDNQYTSAWWSQVLDHNHVVRVPRSNLNAATQAALIYVTETEYPTRQDVVELLTSPSVGGNNPVSKRDAEAIYAALEQANVPFGAQTILPNFHRIPMPGSVFADLRDAWPIGYGPEENYVDFGDLLPKRKPKNDEKPKNDNDEINWDNY